jgi:two-component system CheB/CheR fusion protein
VERANRAFLDHFQVAPEEMVGRLLHEAGNGQWDILPLRQALDVLAKDARLDDFEVEHEFPRIGRRILMINARKLHHDGGRESILLALEDKTEARNIEKDREALFALEQAGRMRAEEADRIKDQFVATLSHELRGPLNSIVGWVHILRDREIDGATRERGMAAIERGVKAQTRLIEDLLDYSRMVTGKLRLAPRLMDLLPVAEAAVGAAQAAADAKEIRLQLLRESSTAMVLGDADRLQQVVWNLVSNAVKFTARGGRVEVSIGRAETGVHLRVSDTGQGISRSFLPHVFERFRQEGGSPSRSQGGLGLGLSIVKQLVELHGGTVEAHSPGEGNGASFTVALPVPPVSPLLQPAEAEPSVVPVEPRASEDAWGGTDRTMLEGVRLLVVEDEADSREMLVRLLEHCGGQVSAAASASETMRLLQLAIPDVLVCDISLPGEDGYELIRRVRTFEAETGRRIPALALTAYTGPQDRHKALAAGFDTLVPKAGPPAQLVAKLAVLAGSRRRS